MLSLIGALRCLQDKVWRVLTWRTLTRYDMADLARLVSPRSCAAVDPFDSQRGPVSGAVPIPADTAAREVFAMLSQSS